MAPDPRRPGFPSGRLRPGLASRPRTIAAVVLVGLLAVLTGCSPGSSDTSSEAPPVTDAPSPVVYVAMGGIETLNSDRSRDLPDNWPQVLFAEHMAPGGVYVNLATEDGTVKSAIDGQLPAALDMHATVATVWLESADLRLGTSIRVYHDELRTMVEDLQAGGVSVYLLRSGPSDGDAQAIQATVAVVGGETGATVVDLGDISDRNDDAGQRHIADTVAAAIGADLGGR